VPRRALPWVGLAVRLVAAAIWLVAGIAKIADLERFRTQVEAYDLLPHALVAPFAFSITVVLSVAGYYLLAGLLVRPVAILTTVLMVGFLVAQAQAWARGLSLDCGCFGTLAPKSHVGVWTVLRDAALGLPGLALAARPSRLLSLDGALLGLEDTWHVGEPEEERAATT
jgi:uncharacterized membrane protein YphA (DoxX/SURF4 family)